VESSVYCLPADLLGEGAEHVAARISERAGAPGLTVAACYHASRDILPHNPVYRVASLAPGAFYAVDPAVYPGSLRPAVSPSAAGRDILAEACQAAAPLGVQVSAWAVFLHRDDLDDRAPGMQENCFGDRFPGRLCPASPAVRDYALGMIRELCRYPIAALRAEALHYQGAAHGHHHERCLEDYGEITRFLLGLCFCRACVGRGAGHDVDDSCLLNRLTRVTGFELRKRRVTGPQDVGGAPQNASTLRSRHRRPLFLGRPRFLDGGFDLSRSVHLQLREHLTGRRIDRCEGIGAAKTALLR